MIRIFNLFCKLQEVKISDQEWFDRTISKSNLSEQVCPYCNSTGRLIPHDSYSRYMVTLKNNRIETVILRIPRVKCTSCGHTHAFLPEMLIPYSSYGLRFVLTVLKDYFLHMHTVEKICKIYQIAHSTLLEVERMYTDFYGLSFNPFDKQMVKEKDALSLKTSER